MNTISLCNSVKEPHQGTFQLEEGHKTIKNFLTVWSSEN